ncbi:hypothetical protein [Flavobacterium flavipallidum]|uniref:Uncharacterized protein n=1 Tax=Flavobacterium flavipallidum TaxID=3139140 RepID=A0ABU9HN70_9FLAO
MINLLKIIFICLFINWNTSTFGQTLDKKYIDDWINETYINPTISEYTLYILNGNPIDKNDINKEFIKYKTKDISSIIYLRKASLQEVYCAIDEGAILINTFNKKPNKYFKKDIKQKLNSLKKELKISDVKYPSVIINDRIVDNKLVKTEINKIELKTILDINIIDVPVNEKKYGKNAKNGLIIIYTN